MEGLYNLRDVVVTSIGVRGGGWRGIGWWAGEVVVERGVGGGWVGDRDIVGLLWEVFWFLGRVSIAVLKLSVNSTSNPAICASSFGFSSSVVPSLFSVLSIFSCSLCGSGGASFGGSTFFSSFVFDSLDFSETPPSVPLVPSFGPTRCGSSITPSFNSGGLSPSDNDASLSFNGLAMGFNGASSSPASFAFFRSRLASVSTQGPACGRPSLPSTGASLVPTAALSRGTSGRENPTLSDRATASEEESEGTERARVVEKAGMRRRRMANGRRRNFMMLGLGLDATNEKRMRVGDGIGQAGVTTQTEVVNIGFRPGQYDRDGCFGSFMCDWGWSRMVMRRKFCGNADL